MKQTNSFYLHLAVHTKAFIFYRVYNTFLFLSVHHPQVTPTAALAFADRGKWDLFKAGKGLLTQRVSTPCSTHRGLGFYFLFLFFIYLFIYLEFTTLFLFLSHDHNHVAPRPLTVTDWVEKVTCSKRARAYWHSFYLHLAEHNPKKCLFVFLK